MTLREIVIISRAAWRRDDRLAWQAAQYVAIAYHDPKNMPADPEARSKGPSRPAEEEVDAAFVRAYFKTLTKG